ADEPEIDNARLKLQDVGIRLAYKTDKGTFPLARTTVFPVAAVFGQTRDGSGRKCYLPFLGESFYYYDDEQLDTMIEHFAREHLEGMQPDRAYRFLMPGKPWLEELQIRIPEQDYVPRAERMTAHTRAALSTMAEQLPRTRSERARLHVFPEAAWEQAALVKDVADKLLTHNVLIVGEPGVGKSVALNEAMRRAHVETRRRERAPTFWRTTGRQLIGGARYLGEWQQCLDRAVEQFAHVEGVAWIVDLIDLLYSEGEGPEDSMAAYLIPALAQGQLRVAGECTPLEFETARRLLPAFIECFHVIHLPEMDAPRARNVVELFGQYAKSNLEVELTPEARQAGYRLLERYVKYQSFPGKAMRFFGECITWAIDRNLASLGEAEIVAAFSRQTGLPELFLRDDLPLDARGLRTFFESRIVGQPAAVDEMAKLVYTFKSGLNDPAKPIATLLFAGPTGVGKTAAAKALGSYFFGAGQASDPLFRVDMSEYQYAFQLGRLLGEGKRPGALIEHVRSRPFSVILLDEIEKADPVIFDVLLGMLDEGRLRDARGRLTDFRSSIVVMTTNLGVRHGGAMGFGDSQDNPEHAIRSFFRPEFFNRIDQVVVFNPLAREHIATIAQRELAAIGEREGLTRRGIRLEFTAALIDHITAVGFSPKYGARPLQRAVERHVVGALSRLLIDEEIADACIVCDFDGEVVLAVR
ncbi:MAG TPA: AAA family ATPase, partial [Burkholderiaceae bacterium]